MPFLAALVVAAAGVGLGEWQRGRALQKEMAAEQRLERASLPPLQLPGSAAAQLSEAQEFRHARARGEFVKSWPIYLDNRPHGGKPGFYLAMPLKLQDGKLVLVLRGWLPRDAIERTRLPDTPTPSGIVQVTGTIRREPGRVMQLGEPTPPAPGAIVQNLQVAEVARAYGEDFLPFIIEQTGDARDGLVRDWPQPDTGADKHRAYAFQWYALSFTALVFFLVTGIRSGRQNA